MSTREKQAAATAVAYAYQTVLGGVRAAAAGRGVSPQAIYLQIGRGYIADRETALEIEEATAAAGERVPASALMGLETWTPPGKGPRKGRRGENGTAPAASAVGGDPEPSGSAPPSGPVSVLLRSGSVARPNRTRCSARKRAASRALRSIREAA